MANHSQLAIFIWQIAELLRGAYRPNQYERVILPLLVLRRFDCILEPTKEQVLAKYKELEAKKQVNDAVLNRVASGSGEPLRFHNHSPLNFERLKADPQNIAQHLTAYINGFSENVRLIFERFDFDNEIRTMSDYNILYLVISTFAGVDLHPHTVKNHDMGILFERLIRDFNEANNQEAGDYFTPRDVIELMVDVLFSPDDDILRTDRKIATLLDPTCGTGGMLSEAQNHLFELNQSAELYVYGQDYNRHSYAVAASDLLIKGNRNSEIRFGDSLTDDKFSDKKFDYFLANPPFGVDWKKQQGEVQNEHKKLGSKGRFGAGLPRVNDGALLFLQHMISKFKPFEPGSKNNTGSRLAIVFNGSPLFTGGAGSGESEIRKWIIEENDWLEAVIALPEQMFFNTGIGTYIWVLSNRKEDKRQRKIQLIDARDRWKPMRRSLKDKRRFLDKDDISAIVCEYGDFQETATSKIFDSADFGYKRVQIERPLRLLYVMDVERKSRFLETFPHLLDDIQAIDRELGREPRSDWTAFDQLLNDLLKRRGNKWKAPEIKVFRTVFADVEAGAEPVILKTRRITGEQDARIWGWFPFGRGQEVMYEPNSDLRDFENVGLKDEVARYVEAEVLPHVNDAWADYLSIRSAYEISFNRYFYTYIPPRPLDQIDSDIKQLEQEILHLLHEITQ